MAEVPQRRLHSLIDVHVPYPCCLACPVPNLALCGPTRLRLAQARRLQLLDLFSEMKGQFPVDLPTDAPRPQRIPNPARPAHHCASASTRATPSVSRRQLCCSSASCRRPFAVIDYNRASRSSSSFPPSAP